MKKLILLSLAFAGLAFGQGWTVPPQNGTSTPWNGGTVTNPSTFAGATDTALTLKAGSAQTSNILSILDNSSVLKTFVGMSNGDFYWFATAPSNISAYGAFAVSATGDASNRLKFGLDQGRGFLYFADGTNASDVGIERSGPGSLQVTAGAGLAGYGNMDVNNFTVHGTCTNCGSGGSGATMLNQIQDFKPSAFTSTTMTFGALTSTSIPSTVTLSGTPYTYTNSNVITITGTANDDTYYYIDPATGFRTFGAFPNANTYACNNCGTPVVTLAAAQYPASVYKIAHCHITAGVPDSASTCSDDRPLNGFSPLKDGYATKVVTSGGLTEIDNYRPPKYISAASYTMLDSDASSYLIFTNAGTTNVSIPQANLGQFRTGWSVRISAAGGPVSLQPVNSQIGNGGGTWSTSMTISANGGADLTSDGTTGVNGSYVVSSITTTTTSYLPTAGGTMTGGLVINTSSSPLLSLLNTAAGGFANMFLQSTGTQWSVFANPVGADSFGINDKTNGTSEFLIFPHTATDPDRVEITQGKLQLGTQITPASSLAACTTGTIEADTGFIYVCTATNTWKRVALSTF